MIWCIKTYIIAYVTKKNSIWDQDCNDTIHDEDIRVVISAIFISPKLNQNHITAIGGTKPFYV